MAFICMKEGWSCNLVFYGTHLGNKLIIFNYSTFKIIFVDVFSISNIYTQLSLLQKWGVVHTPKSLLDLKTEICSLH